MEKINIPTKHDLISLRKELDYLISLGTHINNLESTNVSSSIEGLKIEVVKQLPSTPSDDTIYIVSENAPTPPGPTPPEPPVTPKVIATINVVDESQMIRLLDFDIDPETGEYVYDENLKSVIVDNIEISVEQFSNDGGQYLFDSAGEHTISYEFDDVSDGTRHFYEVDINTIIFPENITSFASWSCYSSSSIDNITILATTPPTLGEESLHGSYPIYVPSESVDAYKTAWSDYADRIQAIQE